MAAHSWEKKDMQRTVAKCGEGNVNDAIEIFNNYEGEGEIKNPVGYVKNIAQKEAEGQINQIILATPDKNQ